MNRKPKFNSPEEAFAHIHKGFLSSVTDQGLKDPKAAGEILTVFQAIFYEGLMAGTQMAVEAAGGTRPKSDILRWLLAIRQFQEQAMRDLDRGEMPGSPKSDDFTQAKAGEA